MTDLDAVRGAAFGPERQDEAGVATKPVTLVQFPHVWGRNISPFALKLEAWLKLADIPFDVRTSTRFGKAPKGKLPYILDEGRPIGNSTLIIEHLKATRGIDPDESLGPPERAQALALQRLVEEHLYFAVVYSRWVDEEGWPLFADAVFGRLRQPLRRAGEFWYREHVRKMLHLQGWGATAGTRFTRSPAPTWRRWRSSWATSPSSWATGSRPSTRSPTAASPTSCWCRSRPS